MEFVGGNVRPSTSAPCGRRDLLTTGPGPDAGGSKPGKEGWAHMPEKSGIAAGPTAGSKACPKAGAAATTAKITGRPKFRRLCTTPSFMAPPRDSNPSRKSRFKMHGQNNKWRNRSCDRRVFLCYL